MLAAVLSGEPLIILVATEQDSPLGGAARIAPHLGGRRATFLVGVHWSLESDKACARVSEAYRRHAEAHPSQRAIYLCNTAAESALLQERGVPAMLANHNMFVDDRVYRIDEKQPKLYDAIYNARMSAYKRHILCRDVSRPALIYYGMDERGRDYFTALKPQLPNAVFVNELHIAALPRATAKPIVGKYLAEIFARRGHPVLPADEVVAHYNRARVGLCLSAVEGAMYTSMEYLLCGLPIVSTVNRGGRDHFFDPEYCITVEADPSAIRRAVDELIGRAIPAHRIRDQTLAKVDAERQRFQAFVQELYREAGTARDAAQDWEAAFIDKMYRNHTFESLLGQIGGETGARVIS